MFCLFFRRNNHRRCRQPNVSGGVQPSQERELHAERSSQRSLRPHPVRRTSLWRSLPLSVLLTVEQREENFPANRGEAQESAGSPPLLGEIYPAFSLVESFRVLKYFHDVTTPAILCHKEPIGRPFHELLIRGFWMPELVLYYIRMLA